MTASTRSLHRTITFFVIFFLVSGMVMIFSATGVLGFQHHGSEFYYVWRHAMTAVTGIAVMVLLSFVRYQVWKKLFLVVLVLQIVLLLLLIFSPLGRHVQGATRWLRFGPLTFQAGELAKITMIVYVAALLSFRIDRKLAFYKVALFLLPAAVVLALILKQPDLGTTVILSAVMLCLFFLAGTRPVYLLSATTFSIVAVAIAILQSDYRRRRLVAFINPWADPQGSGFQTIQSFLSIHSGKVFGVGLGNGNSKLYFLPEVHTDFIFSLIGEELGFIGAAALIGGFIYFSYLLLRVALQAKDSFGCLLGFGLALTLIFQTMVHVGGTTGIIPVKGLPLPFFSWGRTALLVNLAMVGILLNIVKQSEPT